MRPAESDDTRQTSPIDTPTVRIGDAYSDEDDAPPAPPGRATRGPLLWLPLVIFVALLVAGGIVGRFVVPSAAPPPAAAPTTPAPPGVPAGGPPSPSVTPSLPDLATAPPRPADALAGWATRVGGLTQIPVVAVEAYGYAQMLIQQNSPGCHLGWTTLAGIGKVESGLDASGGVQLGTNGRATPPILGPLLDGHDGRALVVDTDGGGYDGDAMFDRTMGPLHLLPSVWAAYRIDADADGILDPDDIDDASATLARYLCGASDDLAQLTGWKAALARYHAGDQYEASVFRAADSYGQLTRSVG
jgi:membrane-bound lytic murein transglycosylase B